MAWFRDPVVCVGCGNHVQDWVWRQEETGECEDCFYKRYGIPNPKKVESSP
jgi:hypothetical protein